MSCYCECPRCGGTDEMAICENALMQARLDVAKAASAVNYTWVWAAMAAMLFFLLASFPMEDVSYPRITDWF